MPKISVIVPVYKVEPYLRKCINSILGQTFRDFELILVDDGSPDRCGEICDEYAQKYDNVIVIHQENGGLSAARNSGIDWVFANSDSQWLALIDSDDWVQENYLKVLHNACIDNQADMALCDFVPVDEAGTVIDTRHDFPTEVITDKDRLFNLLYSNWRVSTAWGKLYHKHIFDSLRYDVGKLHEDEFIIHKVFWEAARVAIVPDALYYYLNRKNSITGMKSAQIRLDSLEAHIVRFWFCRERGIPTDPRLFENDYIFQVLTTEHPEEPAQEKRNKHLKKEFQKVVVNKKKISGIFLIARIRLRKSWRSKKTSLQKKGNSLKYVCREFKDATSEYSFSVALDKLAARLGGVSPSRKEAIHQKLLYRYIKREFTPLIKQVSKAHKETDLPAQKRIWVMWWQGQDSMPELVKACYRKLQSIKGDYQVVLITQSNFSQYITLPEHVLEKVRHGNISLTHLSDIIRCKLLLEYGGLYLDSTIYAENITFVENHDFFTLRTPGKYQRFISKGDWAGFAMYEKRIGSLLMDCMYSCMCTYWKSHDELVDYLMIDYLIRCVYETVDLVRRRIDTVPAMDDYYALAQSMNTPYDPAVWKAMLSQCCWQKLSYKGVLEKVDADGSCTNYGYLISEDRVGNDS